MALLRPARKIALQGPSFPNPGKWARPDGTPLDSLSSGTYDLMSRASLELQQYLQDEKRYLQSRAGKDVALMFGLPQTTITA